MTHDTAMAYLDVLAVRHAELDEAMISLRRQTIRGTLYLMIKDPIQLEEAITFAYSTGLLTVPFATLPARLTHIASTQGIEK